MPDLRRARRGHGRDLYDAVLAAYPGAGEDDEEDDDAGRQAGR